jgi:hypothetical protein
MSSHIKNQGGWQFVVDLRPRAVSEDGCPLLSAPEPPEGTGGSFGEIALPGQRAYIKSEAILDCFLPRKVLQMGQIWAAMRSTCNIFTHKNNRRQSRHAGLHLQFGGKNPFLLADCTSTEASKSFGFMHFESTRLS